MPVIYNEKDMLSKAQSDSSLQVTIVDHPLVRHALSLMRDVNSDMTAFRRAVHSLTPLLIYEAGKDLGEKTATISTPLAKVEVSQVQDKVVLIPVLRSGVGMLEPAQYIFPDAPTIFAGMARDESTAIAHWYYDLKHLDGLKDGRGVVFFILDPMLATGGSAIETVKRIIAYYPSASIKMVAMISAPEGIRALNLAYPEVAITTASVDSLLNSKFYIVPGLGDAGDRQFGT